jgi:AcrR family transcriptional regulator
MNGKGRERARAASRRPGRPPGPSQADQLRAMLIDEASRLYADGGYTGISFSLVAERAGLTKATVFHYFKNKEALVYAIFQALGRRLELAAAGWFGAPPASHAARLERVIGSLVEFYGAEPLNARLLCQGLLEGDRLAPDRTDAADNPPFAAFIRRFSDFIASGIAAGEFYPDRPLSIVMSIGGIILFEFMLPERGQRIAGRVPLGERKREMIAIASRAVVRPGARIARRNPSPSTPRRTRP